MEENSSIALKEPKQKSETKGKTREDSKQKPKPMPMYRVILWNDQDHTFNYVIYMMQKIFGYDKARGMIIATGVHACGKIAVATLPLEVAELRRDQIRSFGPDPFLEECMTSMYATLEPVEDEN